MTRQGEGGGEQAMGEVMKDDGAAPDPTSGGGGNDGGERAVDVEPLGRLRVLLLCKDKMSTGAARLGSSPLSSTRCRQEAAARVQLVAALS